jgi:hypothetical protein
MSQDEILTLWAEAHWRAAVQFAFFLVGAVVGAAFALVVRLLLWWFGNE